MEGPGARRTLLDRLSRGSMLQWALALAISLMLWVTAVGRRTFSVTMRLPVETSELPGGLTLVDEGPDSILVSFTGQGMGVLWDQMTGTPEAVRLDFPSPAVAAALPFTATVAPGPEDLRFRGRTFGRLAVSSFEPALIPLTVDREVTRLVPLRVTSAGELPARYYWQRASSDSIRVTGAASVVLLLDSCRTESVQPEVGSQTAAIPGIPGVALLDPSTASVSLVAPVSVVPSVTGPEPDNPY